MPALSEAVEVRRAMGDYSSALVLSNGLIERIEESIRPGSEGNLPLGLALLQRAELEIESDNPAPAISYLETALPHLVYSLGEEHQHTQEARTLLAAARDASSN